MESQYATLFIGNSNVYPVYQYFRDIRSRNMHNLDLDLDLCNGPMPNTERSYATFYLLPIAMFVLSVTVCDTFAVEMCTTLTLTFRMGQSQV